MQILFQLAIAAADDNKAVVFVHYLAYAHGDAAYRAAAHAAAAKQQNSALLAHAKGAARGTFITFLAKLLAHGDAGGDDPACRDALTDEFFAQLLVRNEIPVGNYLRNAGAACVVGRDEKARYVYLAADAQLGHHHRGKNVYAYHNVVASGKQHLAQLICALCVLLVQAVLRQHLADAVARSVELGSVFICKLVAAADKLRASLRQKIKRIHYVAFAAHFFKISAYRGSCAVMSAAGVAA